MTTPEGATVRAWHEALNRGDVDGLVALSTDDVEVGGPSGAGRGAQLLREWFGRAGIRLEPRREWQNGPAVVVEQGGQWAEAGEQQALASVFTVRDCLVASVVRYPDSASALRAAGLGR
ncbi:MAG: nuclear transport factor 2 family protein [Chloroflexota bacterium]